MFDLEHIPHKLIFGKNFYVHIHTSYIEVTSIVSERAQWQTYYIRVHNTTVLYKIYMNFAILHNICIYIYNLLSKI